MRRAGQPHQFLVAPAETLQDDLGAAGLHHLVAQRLEHQQRDPGRRQVGHHLLRQPPQVAVGTQGDVVVGEAPPAAQVLVCRVDGLAHGRLHPAQQRQQAQQDPAQVDRRVNADHPVHGLLSGCRLQRQQPAHGQPHHVQGIAGWPPGADGLPHRLQPFLGSGAVQVLGAGPVSGQQGGVHGEAGGMQERGQRPHLRGRGGESVHQQESFGASFKREGSRGRVDVAHRILQKHARGCRPTPASLCGRRWLASGARSLPPAYQPPWYGSSSRPAAKDPAGLSPAGSCGLQVWPGVRPSP